jgi:hypothetical protein
LLAKHREQLYELIRFFDPFPFRRVVLDIEPDSLDDAEARRGELLDALIATVAGAAGVTAHPMTLTLHPRYLEGELGRRALPAFKEMGIAEVIVMIYSTNGRAVAERFAAICASGGGLRFSLAQSVEAELPDSESYRRHGLDALASAVSEIDAAVVDSAAEDIVIQDWENYRAMGGDAHGDGGKP